MTTALDFHSDLKAKAFFYLPGAASLALSQFGQFKLEGWNTAYGAAVAGLHYLENSTPKRAELIGKISFLFYTLNIGAMWWEIGKLIDSLDQRFDILKPSSSWNEKAFCAAGWGAMIGWIAVACYTVSSINAHLNGKNKDPKSLLPESSDNVSVKWCRPLGEAFGQWIYVTRTVVNLALVLFSPSNKLLFLINLASQAYSLSKLSERKWFVLTRVFDEKIDDITKIVFHYSFLLFPVADKGGNCVVCQKIGPNFHYCADHLAHDTCIVNQIYQKSQNFFQSAQYSNEVVDTRHGERRQYTITIPRSNLPDCPSCHKDPFQKSIYVRVRDAMYSKTSAYLSLT